jgi:hypothetical protein
MPREVQEEIAETATWDDDGEEPPPSGAAGYIADMTAQLAHLARSAQLSVLAYLLDMAAAEARGSLDVPTEAPPPRRAS